MGNSDTHLVDQLGIPHTVVHAEALTTAAILAGLRAGRSWLAESTAVDLSVTASAGARHAGIGERLHARGGQVVVRAAVRGVAAGTISFHTENGEVGHAPVPGVVEWRVDAAETFVRVEVRHPGGHMAALSNPIVLVPPSRELRAPVRR